MNTVIGLSFGNSASSIAYEKDGKVDVIANQDGDRSIPSAIAYVNGDEYHGQQAKAQLIRNAKNTIVNFRDFIGEPYAKIDPTNSHASAHPIDKDGKAAFTVVKNEQEETMTVEQVAVRHLDRLRESAKDYLGKQVDGCVMAVPTDFDETKRQAIVDVAAQANLKVLQIINEPTAALLAHVSREGSVTPQDKIYVVADFGGIRSDVAVIASRGGNFTVLATVHDYELGGSQLDSALIDYIAKDFEKQYNVDPKSEARSLAKMKAESEANRITLSNTTSSNFAVESLAGGFDYSTTVNRLRFELTGRQVFTQLNELVEKAVKKADLDLLDIDEVLLVGGLSATPKIATSLQQVFDGKTTVVAPSTDTKALNTNELIARGCAIQASLISQFEDEEIKESLQPVICVAPHTTSAIGVKLGNGEFKPMVDIDTPLPIRKVETFTAGADKVLVGFYEGKGEIVEETLEKPAKEEKDDDESDWSEDEEDDEPEVVRKKVQRAGNKLAELALEGVSAGSQIEVVISITKDLALQVAAREVKTGGPAVRGVVKA